MSHPSPLMVSTSPVVLDLEGRIEVAWRRRTEPCSASRTRRSRTRARLGWRDARAHSRWPGLSLLRRPLRGRLSTTVTTILHSLLHSIKCTTCCCTSNAYVAANALNQDTRER